MDRKIIFLLLTITFFSFNLIQAQFRENPCYPELGVPCTPINYEPSPCYKCLRELFNLRLGCLLGIPGICEQMGIKALECESKCKREEPETTVNVCRKYHCDQKVEIKIDKEGNEYGYCPPNGLWKVVTGGSWHYTLLRRCENVLGCQLPSNWCSDDRVTGKLSELQKNEDAILITKSDGGLNCIHVTMNARLDPRCLWPDKYQSPPTIEECLNFQQCFAKAKDKNSGGGDGGGGGGGAGGGASAPSFSSRSRPSARRQPAAASVKPALRQMRLKNAY